MKTIIHLLVNLFPTVIGRISFMNATAMSLAPKSRCFAVSRTLLLALGISVCQITAAQSPLLAWAKGLHGTQNVSVNSMAVDASGNVYTTGNFYGTADFDPGAANHDLTASGQSDIYVAKYGTNGALIWVAHLPGTGLDQGQEIHMDATGNVYITGSFNGTVDFDPGAGTAEATSNGSYDIFLLKLTAGGDFVWVKTFGSTEVDIGYSVTTDASSNIYITGYFQGTVDFDPGAGIYNLTATSALNAQYILKLDSSGDFLMARSVSSTSGVTGVSIRVDASGNIYTCGSFTGTADFDPGAGTANRTTAGSEDVFVSKIDASGNLLWVHTMGATGSDNAFMLALDGAANVYITGAFRGTVDCDPGAGVYNLTSAGLGDAFLLKLNTSGAFQWAHRFGAGSTDIGRAVAVNSGNVYVTGLFAGTIDLDPGAGTFNVTAGGAGFNNLFVVKLDASGTFGWGAAPAGIATPTGLTADAAGNVYIAGVFQGTTDFDPGAGVSELTSSGGNDGFFMMLVEAGTLPVSLLDFLAEKTIAGMIRLRWSTASEANAAYFEVQRSADGRNFNPVGKVNANGNSSSMLSYSFTDSAPLRHAYYRLRCVDQDQEFSYSKVVAISMSRQETLRVFPNPAADLLQVNTGLQGSLVIHIFNAAGSRVQQLELSGNSAGTGFTMDVSSLGKGIYTLLVTNGIHSETGMFMK